MPPASSSSPQPSTTPPKRARGYLVTDEVVEAAATYYADYRPPLDPISQQAVENDHTERMVVPPDADIMTPEDVQGGPDVMLWAALITALSEGATVPDLMNSTGMSRPWIYLRLRDLADAGHVIQVSRGRWRAVTDNTE